jgi:dienelactone hydrolase
MRNFKWRWLLLGLVLLLVVGSAGFVIWASDARQPMSEALAALEPDSQVDVTHENGWYVFRPMAEDPTTGLIFYPGGKVDARAYAPYARAMAEAGYQVVITPMPLNLAVFNINATNDVIQAFPEVEHWAVGGHSLGGSMAARYVQSNPSQAEGLVFWASYPDIDLSELPIQAVSVYATLDGLAEVETVEDSAARLPADAVFVAIEGGNHGQFGWYGVQSGG